MEQDERRSRDSKKMSRALRHCPRDANVTPDIRGWVGVAELARGTGLTVERVLEISRGNSRYELSEDRTRVRALHGHSIPVVYDGVVEPPEVLYHGTSEENLRKIFVSGAILPMGRVMVHMSAGTTKAEDVARRRGTPVILEIDAGRMHRDGFVFHLSGDGIHLTERVPVEYIAAVVGADGIRRSTQDAVLRTTP